ncbi:MAG: dTDP-glucose 4,6-dehydratase [Patescibacteria group bacterium]|nr:dTDP-glucose 4,6-dehydratase [Patescibacteria group bacterium]MDE2015269.1 dTDP-glucose 4,6-dehydratase [Patescibacteria group bacterium]MDE2227075.1 dTDP-glucose 4,6-dehydratase [Patescibacteria group bacterium]
MAENYKNILITGGCGFIGSNFIRHLYKRYPNYKIFNLDALTYAGNTENLADIEKDGMASKGERRYQFLKGDVCDALFLGNLFAEQKFETIVHFAAETHVDRSIFNVSDFVRTNIDGTHALIAASRKYKIPRFIHISTDEIYGSVPEGVSKENAALKPSNPYSTSKACADLLVQSYINTHNAPAIIVRGSNNFGTYQYPEKLIPLAITNIIENEKIPIHGNGEHKRRWLHVEDFCEALDMVMHRAPLGSIYNVSGEEKSNMEILSIIAKVLGVDLDAYKTHTNDRPGADYRYAPDSTKINKELGWSPRHSINEDMPHIVSWYRNNEDWWRKIKAKKEYRDHYLKQSLAQWY